jgi:hypothetical protein
MAEFLHDHPRMMGALFTLVILLAQVQPVLADCNQDGCPGP